MSQIPRRPRGKLTKKMLRQPNEPMSRPPATGPAAKPTPPAAVHQATAWPRKRASPPEAWFSSASEAGTISAAPTPCATRAAISSAPFGARPQPAEAAMNTAKPKVRMRRGPIRSPSAPADRSSEAKAIA